MYFFLGMVEETWGFLLLMQFHSKVHPIVTNLAKNLNGYYLI